MANYNSRKEATFEIRFRWFQSVKEGRWILHQRCKRCTRNSMGGNIQVFSDWLTVHDWASPNSYLLTSLYKKINDFVIQWGLVPALKRAWLKINIPCKKWTLGVQTATNLAQGHRWPFLYCRDRYTVSNQKWSKMPMICFWGSKMIILDFWRTFLN